MSRFSWTAIALTTLAVVTLPRAVQAADTPPPTEDHLAPLARFVGEWEVDGKWSDGSALRARTTYAWGVNKKILVGKTFVQDPTKGEYQRYEEVLAWHPKKKSLYDISFTYSGEINEILVDTVDKDTWHFGYRPFHEDEPSTVRQTLHFTSNDAFVWTVLLKNGDDWTRIIEATWHRKTK